MKDISTLLGLQLRIRFAAPVGPVLVRHDNYNDEFAGLYDNDAHILRTVRR